MSYTETHFYRYSDTDTDGDEFGVGVSPDYLDENEYVDPSLIYFDIEHGSDGGDGVYFAIDIEQAEAFAKGIMLAIHMAKVNIGAVTL